MNKFMSSDLDSTLWIPWDYPAGKFWFQSYNQLKQDPIKEKKEQKYKKVYIVQKKFLKKKKVVISLKY